MGRRVFRRHTAPTVSTALHAAPKVGITSGLFFNCHVDYEEFYRLVYKPGAWFAYRFGPAEFLAC